MKDILRHLAASTPVLLGTRLVLGLIEGASRAASVLRASALFRHTRVPVCHWSVTVKNPAGVVCGEGVVIGPKTTLGAVGGITLGDRVRISEQVIIETGGLDFTRPAPYKHTLKPIVIEADAWLGARCMILQGVTIGERSIIGAGAIVSRDVPPDSVVVGQAPRIRERSAGATFAALSRPAGPEPAEEGRTAD